MSLSKEGETNAQKFIRIESMEICGKMEFWKKAAGPKPLLCRICIKYKIENHFATQVSPLQNYIFRRCMYHFFFFVFIAVDRPKESAINSQTNAYGERGEKNLPQSFHSNNIELQKMAKVCRFSLVPVLSLISSLSSDYSQNVCELSTRKWF